MKCSIRESMEHELVRAIDNGGHLIIEISCSGMMTATTSSPVTDIIRGEKKTEIYAGNVCLAIDASQEITYDEENESYQCSNDTFVATIMIV